MSMTINQLKFSLCALAVALTVAGCGKSESPGRGAGGDSTRASGKKFKLAFVSNNASPFWTIAHAGTDAAVKELNGAVEVDFRIPSDGQAGTQRQMLDDLLARGVDGIAVSPIDPANQTDFLDKVASQTLLITHDSDAPKSKRVCYIGTDNTAAGVEAGKLIREALPAGGKIMMFVGTLDAANAQERFTGIKKELAGSKVEIIDVRTDETDRARAQKNVEDTLVKYPDISALVGLWSYNGPAILNGVKSSGKVGAVKIICFDEEEETLAGVASGAIYGTVVQQPYEFGRQSILRMAKYLQGDQEALAGGTQIVPTLSIKKEGVAEFAARLKTLTGK